VSPRLSAAVMAHPRRAGYVDELLDALDRPAEVVWDQINDRHDTGVRALEAHDPAATHHLVVQDDAVVCRDLIAGIEQALKHCPQNVPLCLYVGRVRPFPREVERLVAEAGDAGASWLTMRGIYWGVGIVVPTADLADLTAWFRTSTVTNYDRRVSTWYQVHNLDIWYPWPSLVDHRGDESLIDGHGSGRFAHRFVGTDRSALDVDWGGAVVDVPRSGQMDQARQQRVAQARRQLRRQRLRRRPPSRIA
jgi:hypothetical protein